MVVAIFSLMTGNATLVVLPVIPVMFVHSRITRPPWYRLQLALKRLRHDFRRSSPPIVQARVEGANADALFVSLVCAKDAQVSALSDQLPTLKQRISAEAVKQGVVIGLVNTLRIRVVSREAVDREGGWMAFDHNVSWPRSNER